MRRPGEMNGLEKRYELHLAQLKASGTILEYLFEALKLRLADKTYYSPDFLVINKDHEIEFHEVKATSKGKPRYEDDAIVKLKVVAEHFPFRFKMVWVDKTLGWVTRDM